MKKMVVLILFFILSYNSQMGGIPNPLSNLLNSGYLHLADNDPSLCKSTSKL
jgi:hypothetical protein